MSILLYPLKMILAAGLLYGYYWFFLRNRQFHRYNRYFLLIAAVIAVITPFLAIPVYLRPPAEGGVSLTGTLQVISLAGWGEPESGGIAMQNGAHCLTLFNGAALLYAAGVAIGVFAFIKSILYLLRLSRKYPCTYIDGIRFYETTEPGTPFSFFRFIFWHRDIPFSTKQGQQIFRHELFHVKQRHSLDILIMELLCCLGWFNPFFHLIKKELKAIHEFLADEYAITGQSPVVHKAQRPKCTDIIRIPAKNYIYSNSLPEYKSQNNRLDYAELLVTHAIRQQNAGISHPFSQHEIKRRIMMITSINPLHRNGGYLRRIMILPLLLVLFSAFAVRWMKPADNAIILRHLQPMTVVIDAGHGGIDAGAINAQGIPEKKITLELAQKVNELAADYNIKVVLTRNNDELPGKASNIQEGLRNRVEIATINKADLFLSLHVNWNNGNEPVPTTGFEAYISKRRPDDRGLQLATALLRQLSTVYNTSQAIKQRDESGILVLDKNNCPAVLLECGFINRPEDLQFITDKAGQEKIARSILEGIVRYREALK